MNEEIRCITNEEKTAKNEWEKDDQTFFQLYTVYLKNQDNSFSILYWLTCLNKDTLVLSQVIKYLNKLISEK